MTVSPETRAEVDDCLLSYTRGIDRLDGELVTAAFHPEAELEGYGRPGAMTIEAFVEYAIPSLRKGYSATQHRISNTSVTATSEVGGTDGLLVESYVLAFHVRAVDNRDELLTFNGRYIDNFELRDEAWKIVRRRLRVDWTRIEPIDAAMPGEYIAGERDRTDVSYPL